VNRANTVTDPVTVQLRRPPAGHGTCAVLNMFRYGIHLSNGSRFPSVYKLNRVLARSARMHAGSIT